MTTFSPETAPEQESPELFDELSPLALARELLLIDLISRVANGGVWREEFHAHCTDYARLSGQALNDTIRQYELETTEAIEEAIVAHLQDESDARWSTYTELILAANMGDEFMTALADSRTIKRDPSSKVTHVQQKWQEHRDQYELEKPEMHPSIRAEFIQIQAVLETSHELNFLRGLLNPEDEEHAA